METRTGEQLKKEGYLKDWGINAAYAPFGIRRYFAKLDKEKLEGVIEDWTFIQSSFRGPYYDIYVKTSANQTDRKHIFHDPHSFD